MAVGEIFADLPQFNSQITPSEENTARDLEIFQQEVQAYLKRLRDAIQQELEIIESELP